MPQEFLIGRSKGYRSISGASRGTPSAFPEVGRRLVQNRARTLRAWVIGPGGVNYVMSEADERGRRSIERNDLTMPGLEHTEHLELKRMLEATGRPHEMAIMDLHRDNLEYARKGLEAAGHDAGQVEFLQGNVAETLPRGKPHVISIHGVLVYVEPGLARAALERMMARLPKGGMLSIGDSDARHAGGFEEITRGHEVIKYPGEWLVVKKA